jgi:PAS domain S-box-containing protein
MKATSAEQGELERLEAELRDSQELAEQRLAELEAVYGLAPIGLCVLDTDLRYLRINERLAEMNGLPVADHIGRTVRELVPGLADGLEPLLRRVLSTGEPLVDYELRGTTASHPGVERYWLESFYPLRAPDGRLMGLNVAVIEITDRKRMEEALRESEARFHAIFDAATSGILLLDGEGRCLEANPASCTMLGRTREEIVGYGPDRFAPAHALPFLMHLQAHLARHPTWRGEIPLTHRDGREVVFEWHISVLGRGVRVAMINDVSDRKRAEQERELLLGAERAARGEAERANRLKDDFLATLSHELRTPLNAILGWVQMLRNGHVKPEGVPRALEVIERNARAQNGLVSDLLDMSRIVSGKLELEVQPVDACAVAAGAVESVRQSAEQKGLRLETDFAAYSEPLSADPARLAQVITNLLTNAVKFTPAGGRVKVSVRRAGGYVEIEVADTGEGIAPDFLPQVFDRFRQADSSTSRSHRGLGLGLSITRQLVELHGGDVRADSAGLGRGSTFTVRLPVPRGRRRSTPATGTPAAARLAGLRVLVVEDEPDAIELTYRLLEASGATVSTAVTAAEALAAIERDPPDVLVSDLGLPGIDGYSLMRAVRRLPPERGGKVPAVALTAFARPEDRERSREAGYQLHLAKPIDPGELCAAVARFRPAPRP